MTYNLSFYLTSNSNYQTTDIKTIDNNILKTENTSTINLHILIGNEHIQLKLSNIYYLPKLDTNLILLGILKE